MTTSIESRDSWRVACAVLAILSVSFGAPLTVVVALKPIAADLAAPRSVPALAAALASFGTGLGGILMGWLADRLGVRTTTVIGALMVSAGLALSTIGGEIGLYLGYGLLLGLLGNGAMSAPLMIYVSRWFDRRRGSALALVASGQYIAGSIWPALFERGIAWWGWRETNLIFAVVFSVLVVPLALIYLHAPPREPAAGTLGAGPMPGGRVLGLHPNLALALLSAGILLCCIPMAQPSVHLVSLCTDLGFTASTGAAMLSVLLASAFVSRQFWGWVGDRVGGLRAVLAGSACQTVAVGLFLATQDEIGLFAVSAAYGLGFAGIVPNYVLAARALFPAREAGWRIPLMLFAGMLGMALGGWMGGAIHDATGSYANSFALGVISNLLNLAVIGFLVRRLPRATWRMAAA